MTLVDGRILRDEGMDAAIRDAAIWLASAHRQGLVLAQSGEPFSIDDITAVVGRPIRPNATGSVIMSLSRRGLIERADRVVQSRHASTHAHSNPVWIGTAAAKAVPLDTSKVKPAPKPRCPRCNLPLQRMRPTFAIGIQEGRCIAHGWVAVRA